tara:strand:- start:3 stop:323 length:321 start_codon:yes stop_codon:yes gene_type:complete
MDTKYLIDLKNQIESLDKIHHVKIFKILKDNEIKFSENRNGIFINMTSFNKNTVKEIEKTLLYIKEQEKNLKDIEAFKKELSKDYFINNDKQIKASSTVTLNESDG